MTSGYASRTNVSIATSGCYLRVENDPSCRDSAVVRFIRADKKDVLKSDDDFFNKHINFLTWLL